MSHTVTDLDMQREPKIPLAVAPARILTHGYAGLSVRYEQISKAHRFDLQ